MMNYQNLYGPRQPQYGQQQKSGNTLPGQPQPPGYRIPSTPNRGPSIPPGERPGAIPGAMPGQYAKPRQTPIDGPGGTQPQSFSSYYGPQIQQAQQRFPGFMNNARQQWQQMRQQQGPGFWRQYMDPNQGMQQNFPGFLNMYQQMMGGQPPQRFMNMAQNRGWTPTGNPSIPPGERPDPMLPYRVSR